MLVELDEKTPFGPALVEVSMAQPDSTMFLGKETGRTALVITQNPHASNMGVTIDLTYPEFRWAYARSVKNGEPFLDLKTANLIQIKRDYAQYKEGGAINDRFPHRPS